MSYIDLSDRQPNPPPPTRRRKKDGSIVVVPKVRVKRLAVERPLEAVTGATLHATGCYLSPGKEALRRAGGDVILARAERAIGVHAHITCFRDGTAVQGYPLSWYVYHGHAFCSTDVGIEHEGNWGVDGVPVGTPDDYDIGRVIDAGRAALTRLAESLPNLRYVHLHRQTRGSKPACPGPVIAREVGLWACRKLGLTFEPERTWRDGKPIPPPWLAGDPTRP